MKKIVRVVGAIIENNKNEFLCTLRSPLTNPPNLWDLPGGEIKDDDSLESAIKREISNSLDFEVKFVSLYSETYYEYPDNLLKLITVYCKIIKGIPKDNQYTKILWLKKENLMSLHWIPSSLPIIEDIIS